MKKLFGTILAVGLVSFAAGCASTSGIQGPPVDVTYREGFDQSRLKWAAYPIVFRSYENVSKDDQPELRELVNSRCQLNSNEFQASFLTPASVNMPVIQGQPSVAVLRCVNGPKSGGRNIVPFTDRKVFVGDPVTMLVGNIAAGIAASRQQFIYSYRGELIQVVLAD